MCALSLSWPFGRGDGFNFERGAEFANNFQYTGCFAGKNFKAKFAISRSPDLDQEVHTSIDSIQKCSTFPFRITTSPCQQQSAQKGHENCPGGIYGHLAVNPSFWATFHLTTGRPAKADADRTNRPGKVEHAQLNAKEQSGQKKHTR